MRYQLVSEETAWWPRGPSLGISLRSAHPTKGLLDLVIVGAESGELDVRVYDLQGREVEHQHAYASSWVRIGCSSVCVDRGEPLPAAVYFVRATDRTGRASQALKAVVLR